MGGASRFSGKSPVSRSGRQVPRPDYLAPDDAPDPFATGRQPSQRQDGRPASADAYQSAQPVGPPRLTLPSVPTPPAPPSLASPPTGQGDTGRRRSPRVGASERQVALGSGIRPRERTAARPLSQQRTSLPSPPEVPVEPEDEYDGYEDEWEADWRAEDENEWESPRALIPAGPLPRDLTPDLAAYKPGEARRRSHVNTQMLLRRARSPWTLTRLTLAVAAISAALLTAHTAVGEPSQPLMASFKTASGSQAATALVNLVQPETQGMRPDLYDSTAQFRDWWDAACSAAVMSEVLTAWGVPKASIGRLIDVMQPDISLNGGLLRAEGFQRGAAAFGYRADLNEGYSYKQLLYIANYLGLPVIVNVRISYGYYHFFSGGHFLVLTGGDEQGVRIVDSSEYYIHYLPKDVFYSMFTLRTTVVVPKNYHYSVPSL